MPRRNLMPSFIVPVRAAAERKVIGAFIWRARKNLLAALRPRTFLYTSSTSVYAQTDGEWVDETSAAEPRHETGRILRETEDLVRQENGLVARLAGIYGPGRSALLRKFLSGEARIEEGGERYLNQAHRDDIAAALFHLVGAASRAAGNF